MAKAKQIHRERIQRFVRISAPCRLHFGLLSFGRSQGRQYGGAGLMLSRPRCCLQVQHASSFKVDGQCSQRVVRFATAWMRDTFMRELPPCRVSVLAALPSHVGLGSGTQLALATALALDYFFERPRRSPPELASCVDRGQRSAVGTYGFFLGGFISEPGKSAGELLAPLDVRIEVPAVWRVLLVRPSATLGVSGAAEQSAFSSLPPVPVATTRKLTAQLQARMIPALKAGDVMAFGESVYQYGRLAGECFATCQGGPFASQTIGKIVDFVRSRGVPGVGQSSWGPTVFAVLPNAADAERLILQLRDRFTENMEYLIAAPNNSGVEVSHEQPT